MSEVFAPLPDSLDADFDRLRDACGRIQLSQFGLIELTGEDRKGWLQGQATNDLRQLDNGAYFSFCLCSPTGQIVSNCEIWGLADRFILAVPLATLEPVLKRIEQMVVMEDVAARDLTPDVQLVSIQGPTATRDLGELVTLPLLDAGLGELEGTPITLLRSNRTGLGGWDVLVPREAKKALKKLQNRFDLVSDEAFDAARLEAGRPSYGLDIDERTLPPELGQAFESRNVSYNKGCYVGQEVLMRLHSRGHANRRWVGLMAEEPLEVGAKISHRNREDGGTVTSCAFSPDRGYIAGAMLRHEIGDDGEVVMVHTTRGPVQAEVQRMPLLRLD
jgi:folate-binding protein YgfZ